jgi:hypothetical protein
MTDQIVDYAYPCMVAERTLKDVHNAVLRGNIDEAISLSMRATAECRLLTVALKEMKERENALYKQASSV